MTDLKRAQKFLDFEFTTLAATKDAGDECVISGMANCSNKDRVGDVVLPSAFKSSLELYMSNPVALFQHDWSSVAGSTIEASITETGLAVKIRISDTRPDIKQLVREKSLRCLSIGYNEKDSDFDEATKTKIVKDLELLEISIVSVPANPEAKFTVVTEEKKPDEPKPDSVDVANEAAADREENAEQARDQASGIPKSYKSAKELKDFIITVKEACGSDDLGDESIVACCDYFNSNEETMKKDELIKLLRDKVKDAVPAEAPKAADPKPADGGAPAEEPKPAAQDDALKAILAKLSQIADGVAQLLEMEQDEEKPEADAPAEDEAKLATELEAVEAEIATELAKQ